MWVGGGGYVCMWVEDVYVCGWSSWVGNGGGGYVHMWVEDVYVCGWSSWVGDGGGGYVCGWSSWVGDGGGGYVYMWVEDVNVGGRWRICMYVGGRCVCMWVEDVYVGGVEGVYVGGGLWGVWGCVEEVSEKRRVCGRYLCRGCIDVIVCAYI